MVQCVGVPGGHFICCLYSGGLWESFATVKSPRMAAISSVGIACVPYAEALPTLQRLEVSPRSVPGLRCDVYGPEQTRRTPSGNKKVYSLCKWSLSEDCMSSSVLQHLYTNLCLRVSMSYILLFHKNNLYLPHIKRKHTVYHKSMQLYIQYQC